ncbi:MAG: DNA repair protein RecO [Acidobacteria bacterium]|nr:MAG: DNA repair protein RecO [Acidobacteriota bacterium]
MGLNETEAFVLRTYKLAEADKIILLLTRKAGLLRGVAHGARKLKSRFGASFELFTLVSLSYYEKETRELVSIRQAEILRSYFHLANKAEIVSALNYLSELIVEFVPPHDPNEKLFRMIRACLDTVAEAPAAAGEVVRYFEVWLLKLSGFLPDVRACAICRRQLQAEAFLSTDSTLQCNECAQGVGLKLDAEAQARLRTLLSMPPDAWAQAGRNSSKETQQQLAQLAHRLIAKALERTPRSQRTEG